MLPAEERLPEGRPLVEGWHYFVVHAPRQTGKTTTLRALARQLTAAGQYAALWFSCEPGEAAADDYGAAELQVLAAIRREARVARLPAPIMPPDPWPDAPPGSRLTEALEAWSVACPIPLALFFDEIDALRGQSLVSVLRQIRAGFPSRAQAFPASIILCGLRDVRDYKAASGGDPNRLGTASPFNIKIASLRIGDFSADEVSALYEQHTAETGQKFTPGAVERAFTLTQGQPWLVNALAHEIISAMGISPPEPITAGHVETAKERLILARATHLGSLVSKLNEPRVRRVVEPLIAGTLPVVDEVFSDDVAYVRDLGLIAADSPIRIANPIYREVIVRVLGSGLEEIITERPDQFVFPDGRLDFPKVLRAFTAFWTEHEEILTGIPYREVSMQLVFMTFLTRIVNGGGTVDREYGVGKGRIDLLVRRPYGEGLVQREAIELKVWHPGKADPLKDGLTQLDGYLDRFQLDTGTLVIFDRRPNADPVHERTAIARERSPAGRAITLLRA
jgi:hypothetical protein